ncbi:MAG: hypothetical protein AB4911_24715 [Oscillochloridaceae bacterium umkhey_bin13]
MKAIAWHAVLGLLTVGALFLILDPLAPPSFQGAAPRYIIFVLPIVLLVLALGANNSRILWVGLITSQLTGLTFLHSSNWSYGTTDLIDWPHHLKQVVIRPEVTCLVVDGRARSPVERYAPAGVQIVNTPEQCMPYERIILITADNRLALLRPFDKFALTLVADHRLAANITQFPAQFSTYDKAPGEGVPIIPGRLDLPERDLVLPVQAARHDWTLHGFVRLDGTDATVELAPPAGSGLYLLSNYRNSSAIPDGTPIATIRWTGTMGEEQETTIRAGVETADWNGRCTSCEPVFQWTKRLSLVGARSYPDAYRHYQATVWASPLAAPPWSVAHIVVTSLLDDGTFYFWGIYPASTQTEARP